MKTQKDILFLLLFYCIFSSISKADPKNGSAIILSKEGDVCLQKIIKCISLSPGQELHEFDRLKVGQGGMWIYNYNSRRREFIQAGVFTPSKKIEVNTDSKDFAEKRLRTLSNISMRNTSSLLLRSNHASACPKLENNNPPLHKRNSCRGSEYMRLRENRSLDGSMLLPTYSHYTHFPKLGKNSRDLFYINSGNSCINLNNIDFESVLKEWDITEPIHLLSQSSEHILFKLPDSCYKKVKKELDIIDTSILDMKEIHLAKHSVYLEFNLLYQAKLELLKVLNN